MVTSPTQQISNPQRSEKIGEVVRLLILLDLFLLNSLKFEKFAGMEAKEKKKCNPPAGHRVQVPQGVEKPRGRL